MHRSVALPAVLLAAILAPPALAATVQVEAVNGAFAPEVVRIAPGDTVTWTNADGRAHTVTSSWDDGATFHAVLRRGESFSHTFEEAGTYPVHCVPHATRGEDGTYSGMVATVVVEAPPAASEGRSFGSLLPVVGFLAVGTLLTAGLLRYRGASRGSPRP